MYTREEELEIAARIGITEEAYKLLRRQKRKTHLSMAKLLSNLILETYGDAAVSEMLREPLAVRKG